MLNLLKILAHTQIYLIIHLLFGQLWDSNNVDAIVPALHHAD